MVFKTITLQVPQNLYLRLEHTAHAMQRSVSEVFLHTLNVGSPPAWEDIPAEFQADLAALDRLDHIALWDIARSRKAPSEMARHDELLERNQSGTLTDAERLELQALRNEIERFMLRKAHAAALLHWRGQPAPP
jgi:hypothetical protein